MESHLRQQRLPHVGKRTFQLPESRPVRARHLESDKKLTWTFGIRDTLNSNPLNPHQHIARLTGVFQFHIA